MTQPALSRELIEGAAITGWRGHLIALGCVAVAILLLFVGDASSMVSIWWNASTFGHCIFIPLLIGWLVQQRLPGLSELEPVAWPPGLLWLSLGAFAWLLGAAAGVAVIRHGALVVMLQGAVIALLGPVVARALLFPLFYAFFMVPVGEEIVAPLQLVTARLSMLFLTMAGVPAHMDGIFITTPTGYFEVAEACSGAKFVIAMTAYGVLVCHVCFRSWRRRILFMTGALALSIFANGLRAFATILVAHWTSVDSAVGFDHVVYGWVFFAVIMAVVMAVAWPFFDRKPGDPWFDPQSLRTRVRLTAPVGRMATAVLVIGGIAPLWFATSAGAAQPLKGVPQLPAVPGWHRIATPPLYPWKPRFDGADYIVVGRYGNAAGQVVDLAIATYDRQEEGRELVGFAQGAADPDQNWVWSSPAAAPADGLGEQITAPGPVVRHVVSFYSVGGAQLTGTKPQVKLDTLKARMLGGSQSAVAILVSAEARDGSKPDAAISAFLNDLGNRKDLADRSVALR